MRPLFLFRCVSALLREFFVLRCGLLVPASRSNPFAQVSLRKQAISQVVAVKH